MDVWQLARDWLVTTFGSESGSMIATTRMGELANCCRIEAIGLIGESRRDVGLLAVPSADRLHAGWTAARQLRRDRRGVQHLSHIEKLLAPLPRDCGIVTVIDGHPATLGWLGSVCGHRVEALGVEHVGQTGTIDDLYRHYGLDANAIIDAAESLTAGAPVRHRKMAV